MVKKKSSDINILSELFSFRFHYKYPIPISTPIPDVGYSPCREWENLQETYILVI